MPQPEYNIDDIIANAIGDKPVTVQKAFDNVMVQRAADIIAGKREQIAKEFSIPQDSEISDDELLADPTDDELEDIVDSSEEDIDDEDIEVEDDDFDDSELELETDDEPEDEPEEVEAEEDLETDEAEDEEAEVEEPEEK